MNDRRSEESDYFIDVNLNHNSRNSRKQLTVPARMDHDMGYSILKIHHFPQ